MPPPTPIQGGVARSGVSQSKDPLRRAGSAILAREGAPRGPALRNLRKRLCGSASISLRCPVSQGSRLSALQKKEANGRVRTCDLLAGRFLRRDVCDGHRDVSASNPLTPSDRMEQIGVGALTTELHQQTAQGQKSRRSMEGSYPCRTYPSAESIRPSEQPEPPSAAAQPSIPHGASTHEE